MGVGPCEAPDLGQAYHSHTPQRRTHGRAHPHGTEVFYHVMARTLPAARPFRVLPWPPRVSLALFVHRVSGLAEGIYVLARAPEHVALLRAAIREDFSWQRPERCPSWLDLFQLLAGDARQAAEIISCHQSIAGDGAFSLGACRT
ncbi:MAG: hypothetical protein ACREYE_27220 [Gammaproteobacteria bacterium]